MHAKAGMDEFDRRFQSVVGATWKVVLACIVIEFVVVSVALLIPDLPRTVRAVLLSGSVLLMGAILLSYLLVKGNRALRRMDQARD